MERLTFNKTANVKSDRIWITTVVDEAWLVAVEHAIETKREKLVVVGVLNFVLPFFLLVLFIHVEKVAKTLTVVESTSHITLLFCDDFTCVLSDKCSSLNVLHRVETPHYILTFLNATNLDIIFVEILRLN